MKGKNVITLCEAAMIEVAQKWINDKSYGLDVVVDRVEQATDGDCPVFRVHLSEKPAEVKK